MNIKKIMSVALAGMVAISIAGCNIIERTPESIGKTVLAKVDGDKITRDDLDKEMKSTLEQYKSYYGDDFESNDSIKENLKEARKSALDYLVQEKVLKKAAVDLDVMPSDDDIDNYVEEQVNKLKEYNGNDDDKFNSYLDSIGYTLEEVQEYYKTQFICNAAMEKIVEDASVSDEEVQNYYNEHKDSYKEPAGADVTHVLFTGDNAEANVKKAKEYADKGKSLEDISKLDEFKGVSTYEDLGHKSFENSGLVKEFEDAFKALPANKVSDPVKTSYGWHLIYNTKVNAEEYTPSFDEVKDKVKESQLNEKKQSLYEEKIEEYKEKYKTKTYEDRL